MHGYYLWIVSMMENAWKDHDVLQQANTVGVQVVENVRKVNGTSDGEGVFPLLAEFHQEWMKMFGRVENERSD